MRAELRHYRGGRLIHESKWTDGSRAVAMLKRRMDKLSGSDKIVLTITA